MEDDAFAKTGSGQKRQKIQKQETVSPHRHRCGCLTHPRAHFVQHKERRTRLRPLLPLPLLRWLLDGSGGCVAAEFCLQRAHHPLERIFGGVRVACRK